MGVKLILRTGVLLSPRLPVILSQDDVQALKADRGYVVVTVHFLPPTRPPLRLELALEKVSMVQGKEGVLGPMDLLDGRTCWSESRSSRALCG